MTKSFGAMIAGCLVCLVAGTIAWAQADPAPDASGKPDAVDQNSKSDDSKTNDQGKTKPGQMKKNPGKDPKAKSPKSTGKKTDSNGASSSSDSADISGTPDSLQNPNGQGAPSGKAADPNWSVDQIHLDLYGGAKYSQDKVNIEPTKGQQLVQASFLIEALRTDPKAVERYAKGLNPALRKEMGIRAKSGARVLEARRVYLRAPDGKQFAAVWLMTQDVRTTMINVEVAPNRESSQSSTSGSVNPNGPWLDAEQQFITRTARPFNQPPVTEYLTFFTGVLRTEKAFPMTFLFSVPDSLDLKTLKLVVDTESFAIGE